MAALSQSSGYAVLALGFIASAAGRPLLVRTIAEKCDLPAPYLAKIVNKLARAGLVFTQRGVNGGVTIAKDPQGLTLLEVCEALDDPILEKRCMLGVAECSDERACPAHQFAMICRRQMFEFLSQTTIADVAAFETQRRWNGGPSRRIAAPAPAPLTVNGTPSHLPPADGR